MAMRTTPGVYVNERLLAPSTVRAGDVFSLPVRVYWEDTDAGGVVFYANYLKFFERARTEWLRAHGIGQQQLRDETGGMFVVVEAALRYRQPARLDDQLLITCVVKEPRTASLTLSQQALCAGLLLVESEVRMGFVDAQTFKPARIPDFVLNHIA